ncbi:MAG: hypothetical protein AAF580_13485 [Pseudomonadota bacterium]
MPGTRHGTALVVGEVGLLIVGPSGSGKTSLALAIIERADDRGLFSALVGDDRVIVSKDNGRTIARAPPTLAGLAELSGIGIGAVRSCPSALLRAVLSLSAGDAPCDFDAAVDDATLLPLIRLGARRCKVNCMLVLNLIGDGEPRRFKRRLNAMVA